jgi:glycine cleavage system H protein
VNSDSFGEGWLMKVKMSDSGEVDSLLDSAAYAKQCEE